jgi:signal transduction histidine kinase
MLSADMCALSTPAAAAVQLSNMELTKQQGNVMAALKQGNDALKQAQQEVRRQSFMISSTAVTAAAAAISHHPVTDWSRAPAAECSWAL